MIVIWLILLVLLVLLIIEEIVGFIFFRYIYGVVPKFEFEMKIWRFVQKNYLSIKKRLMKKERLS